jgi:pilus assembly protein Flp/PilA
MIKKLIGFCKDEKGATMVEYGLMVALIAVVCIGAVIVIGSQLNITFDGVGTALETANAS